VAVAAEELTLGAKNTNLAAEQITLTIQEIARGSEKQMRSVEVSGAAIEEVSFGARQISESAHFCGACSPFGRELMGSFPEVAASIVSELERRVSTKRVRSMLHYDVRLFAGVHYGQGFLLGRPQSHFA